MKRLKRSTNYLQDLAAIESYIAQDSRKAAMEMWLHIDDQVEKLTDPNFPRRIGRVKNTLELVAHPNYIVVLEEDAENITALGVLHVRRQYP